MFLAILLEFCIFFLLKTLWLEKYIIFVRDNVVDGRKQFSDECVLSTTLMFPELIS